MLLRDQLSVALYLVMAFRWDMGGILLTRSLLSIRARTPLDVVSVPKSSVVTD